MKELVRSELMKVNGGLVGLPVWFKNSIWGMAVIYVIDHWSDLKAGVVEGYKDGKNSN
ncbi:MAG: hypothetical protein M0R39_07375 [Prolixibacteraceae bacterium]|jgi:hypothetical protein|nr:hypothetical protein [Prolixibacteraceae bacterium]